jgi:hypothetical protein
MKKEKSISTIIPIFHNRKEIIKFKKNLYLFD